jgi:hypothetical protein
MGLVLRDNHERQCVHIFLGDPRFIQPHVSHNIIAPSARERPNATTSVVKGAARELMCHVGVVIRGMPPPKACGANAQCFSIAALLRPTSRASRGPANGAPARMAARRPRSVIVPWCAQPMVPRTAKHATPATPLAQRCAPADVDPSNPHPLRPPTSSFFGLCMPYHAMPCRWLTRDTLAQRWARLGWRRPADVHR